MKVELRNFHFRIPYVYQENPFEDASIVDSELSDSASNFDDHMRRTMTVMTGNDCLRETR